MNLQQIRRTMETPNAEELLNLFRTEFQVEVPSLDFDLFETGILDSLKVAELLMYLETKFDVRINPDHLELDNFRSIARISNFVSAGFQSSVRSAQASD